MSGYFHARRAYSVSTRTGIVYIAGEEQPRKASHDKTEPREPCPQRTQAQGYSDTGLGYSVTGIGELASGGRGENPAEILGEKKSPAMPKSTAGEVLGKQKLATQDFSRIFPSKQGGTELPRLAVTLEQQSIRPMLYHFTRTSLVRLSYRTQTCSGRLSRMLK